MTAEPPAVSIIVPVRNAEHEIGGLLEALGRQTLPAERRELLVVDDASRDGTAAVVRRSRGATLIQLSGWSGAYTARNAGLAAARGDVIAFADADCRPAPDWLERGLAELDRLGADLLGGHIDVRLGKRPSIAELLDYGRHLDQERGVRERGFAMTANLLARRTVFERVGTFLEGALSDADREFCLRATEAGFELAYSRHAAVAHPARATARGLARRAFRDGYGYAQMARSGGPHARRVPRLWMRPGAYLPRRIVPGATPLAGIDRLRAAGRRPTATTLAAMELAEWLLIQLPMAAGNLTGALASRARRLPAPQAPRMPAAPAERSARDGTTR